MYYRRRSSENLEPRIVFKAVCSIVHAPLPFYYDMDYNLQVIESSKAIFKFPEGH